MTSVGHFTLSEILSQPDAWRAALDVIQGQAATLREFYRSGKFDRVVFIGCGSTYYLSIAAAALFRELTGQQGLALPASEVWLYPQTAFPTSGRTLLVAVSRSGETTETIRACEAFRSRKQGAILTLSCYPDKRLPALGDVNILIPSGQENSVAQTRAFTSLYIAAVAVAALWADNESLLSGLAQLPPVAEKILTGHRDLAHRLGPDLAIERFYFLGSGLYYGLAAELSLKMKEMTLSHSEPFHFMEFRHGPKSMVTPSTIVVGIISQANQKHEEAVLSEMQAMGATILSMGTGDALVRLPAEIPDAARGALYLPVGQLVAFERSIAKGLDPDRPNNLDAVVRLDGTT